MWNNTVSQMPLFFPTGREENWLICISSVGDKEFSVLMTDVVPDVHYVATSQCFPLYLYDRAFGQKSQDLFSEAGSSGKEGRRYAITDTALTRFRTQYQTLGMFRTFTEAGRKLADLHVNYESVEPYDGVTVDGEDSRNYRVEQLKYGKIPGKTGNAGKDKTVIVYNGSIVIRNIPLKAQEYVVNRKSALDWLVERIGVSVDKDSGIVNDFNKFAEEKGEPVRPAALSSKFHEAGKQNGWRLWGSHPFFSALAGKSTLQSGFAPGFGTLITSSWRCGRASSSSQGQASRCRRSP